MKKLLQFFVPLTIAAVGVAAFVVAVNNDLSPLTRTLFSCVYTAGGFAAFTALGGKKGQLIAFMVPFGVVISGYHPFEAVIFVAVLSVRALYRALIGSNEGARAADIALSPGSGFLVKSVDGQYFQLLHGPAQLYLINLGSRGSLSTSTGPIRAEEAYVPKDWDRVIPFGRLRSIRIRHDGTLRIRGWRGGLFFLQPPATADDVAAYLAGLPVVLIPPPAPRLSEEGARTLHRVFTALSYLNLACAGIWIYRRAPSLLFAALDISLLFVAFILYCLFRGDIASGKGPWKESIAGYFPLVAALPLLYYYPDGYRFASAAQFVPPVAILSGCALLLFLLFNARRRPWGTLLVSLPTVVFFSVFIVGNLNVLLDDAVPIGGQTAAVLSKTMDDIISGTDTYMLRVGPPVDRRLEVSRAVYEAVDGGDEVFVATYAGPLGIDYTGVELTEGEKEQ